MFCSRLCFFRRRHTELLSELSWSSSCQCRGALKCSSYGDGFPAPPPAFTVTEGEGQNSDKMRVDYIWANCFLLWRQSRRSEVENGDVKQVTQTFCLVQVVYVVVVTGWRWQAKERREHWGWKREIHETYYREVRSGTLQRGINYKYTRKSFFPKIFHCNFLLLQQCRHLIPNRMRIFVESSQQLSSTEWDFSWFSRDKWCFHPNEPKHVLAKIVLHKRSTLESFWEYLKNTNIPARL